MRRYKAQIRRYRVSTRPKLRSRRLREFAAVAFLLVLGGAAALTLPRLSAEFPGWPEIARRAFPGPFVVVGVPASLEEPFSRTLAQAEGTSYAKAARLKASFPGVRAVRVRHDWIERRVRFEVEMRQALAKVVHGGRLRGHLAADGSVFMAPEELRPAVLPEVDLEGADAAERRRVAEFLAGFGGTGGVPGTLERMGFVSKAEGWEARLADGTTVFWGDLRWTAEKVARLKQVLEDSRRTLQGALTADMRYFEDGKIYVRLSRPSS
ncbi:MAG: hypothetical protein HY927_12335 [Elusimicrobia bacterium]|nr:hypothetical protein [Elusimicrobiota bacterium]